MDKRQIIMNYATPPSLDDLGVIAEHAFDNLPEELIEYCDEIAIQIEELADEALEQEFDLDDPFEMVVLFRKGGQISPGVEKKSANDDDVLTVFRRPVLDIWCETGDDLSTLVRQFMIEELGSYFNFSDEEIEEMAERHYQGML